MKNKSSDVIDEFYAQGLENKRVAFKLTKYNRDRYSIKRDDVTLLIYPEERKARAGFNVLKQRSMP